MPNAFTGRSTTGRARAVKSFPWSRPLRQALLAAAAIAFGWSTAAYGETGLNIDKSFGSVSGWNVGFSNGIGGCLAAAKYRDQTTVWFGFAGEKPSAYIAFSNPQWRSVEVDGRYDLQLVMGRTT